MTRDPNPLDGEAGPVGELRVPVPPELVADPVPVPPVPVPPAPVPPVSAGGDAAELPPAPVAPPGDGEPSSAGAVGDADVVAPGAVVTGEAPAAPPEAAEASPVEVVPLPAP